MEGWRGHSTAHCTDYTHTNRRPLTSRVSQYELKHIKSTYIYWSQYLSNFHAPPSDPKRERYIGCSRIGDRWERSGRETLMFTIFRVISGRIFAGTAWFFFSRFFFYFFSLFDTTSKTNWTPRWSSDASRRVSCVISDHDIFPIAKKTGNWSRDT